MWLTLTDEADDLNIAFNKYNTVLYEPRSNQYETFKFIEHFKQIREMKTRKNYNVKLRNNLINQIDVRTTNEKTKADSAKFIRKLCVEYGDESFIRQKFDKFKNAIDDAINCKKLESCNLEFFSVYERAL